MRRAVPSAQVSRMRFLKSAMARPARRPNFDAGVCTWGSGGCVFSHTRADLSAVMSNHALSDR
jgi:hypothetical protein